MAAAVRAEVESFRAAMNLGPDAAKKQLSKLKIALTTLKSYPLGGLEVDKDELYVIRDALELATLFSVKSEDIPSFERHFAQVKPYYFDFKMLDESPQKHLVLGLNLLRLLTQGRIAEFHTEVELIPIALHSNKFINHAIMLEQHLMEGNYSRIMNARAQSPDPSYDYFLNILLDTVREEIADCVEKAYGSLPVGSAKKMLLFNNASEFSTFCTEREWVVDMQEIVHFAKKDEERLEVPSWQLIQQSLSYAKELERIV